MTSSEFNKRLVDLASSRSTNAARRVLVDGMSINAAAREAGLDPMAVSRAVKRIRG